jgi:hypothetical protein
MIRRALVLALVLALACASYAYASTRTRYAVTLRCAHIVEDSAAHVRLVIYDPPRIVYACKRAGY